MSSTGTLHRFTEAEDQAIIAGYTKETLAAIAARLGVDSHSVASRARTLVRRGALDPTRRHYGRAWTADDKETLRERWGWQEPARVAKALRRTLYATIKMAKRLGLCLAWKGRYNGLEVAGIFGVDSHAVAVWVGHGWIEGTRSEVSSGRSRRWSISHEAVEAFIRNHPLRYERRRITEAYWRELADAAARDVDTVNVKQAAVILGCNKETIKKYLGRGWLRGERIQWAGGFAWRIRRADLDGFAFRRPVDRWAAARMAA